VSAAATADRWPYLIARWEYEEAMAGRLPAPPSTAARGPFCPNATVWHPSCKRRDCPVCGPRWARNWRQCMEANLTALGRPVTMIAITPPGADRLPWDRSRCRHRPGVRCSGKRGCRVQDRALREWCDTLTLRWGWLRRAARQAVKRAGFEVPPILERVWEPQKRGTPHLHLVMPFGAAKEPAAVQRFAEELSRLAPDYDFGHVDRGRLVEGERRLQPIAGAEAARYLAHYLTGRSRKKASIRDNIADPRLPRSLIWLAPRLTRITGCTMRRLRYVRWAFAGLAGRVDAPPRLRGQELVDVALAMVWVHAGARARAPTERELRVAHLHEMSRLRDLRVLPAAA
jgi:hypothetical protein